MTWKLGLSFLITCLSPNHWRSGEYQAQRSCLLAFLFLWGPFIVLFFSMYFFFKKKKLTHVSLYLCLWVNCHKCKGYSCHSPNFTSLITVYLLLTAVFCKGLFGKDAGNAPSSQSYYVPKSQEFHLKAIRNLHGAPTCVPCCSVSKRTFVL